MTPAKFYKLDAEIAARRDLTAGDKLVYAAIADHARGRGTAWPGTRRLAGQTGLNRLTVLECIHRLAERTDLRVVRQGNGQVNRYEFSGGSGRETQPVGKPDRSENPTPGGRKTRPEAVGKPNHNRVEPLNRKKSARRRKPPPDPRVRVFIEFFAKQYQDTLGRKYVVAGGKDGDLVKKLLARVGDNGTVVAELQRATKNMLADPWGRQRACIGILSSQINSWLGSGEQKQRPGDRVAAPSGRRGKYPKGTRVDA